MLSRLRRTTWFSGAVALVLAVAIAAPAAYALGIRSWPFSLGIIAGVLLLMGWLERLWKRRPVLPKARQRSKFKVVSGGKQLDLGKEDSNDTPRWLM